MPTKLIGVLCSTVVMAAFILTSLGGCAIVDDYGSRAIEYNEQTATAKSSTVLLNILRAAYHEPLQFTDLSTVTGTASASAGINASIPFKIGGAHFTAPNILTLTPSTSVSGGPNFSVANLNTQEFYQGLQSPISARLISNYEAAGVPPIVLLPLFLSYIEVDESDKIKLLHNSGSWTSYQAFLSATQSLIVQGLHLEDRDKPAEFIGPSLSREEASDPKLLSGLVQAIAAGSSSSTGGSSPTGGSSLSLKEVKKEDWGSSTARYRLSKPGTKSTHFCLRPTTTPFKDPAYTVSPKYTGKLLPVEIPIVFGYGAPELTAKTCYCAAAESADKSSDKASAPRCAGGNELKTSTRSLEGIFFFLGEIVRNELGLSNGVPVDYDLPPDAKIPLKYLFKVEPRLPLNGEISANFHGLTYTIAADPSGRDASSQVVQLLTDLLALQSSAKNLPPPNVIAISP
jgi:hypothetical protein